MSENEAESSSETQNRSSAAAIGLAFVAAVVLTAVVLYFAVIGPRGTAHGEAREIIAQLEDELAQLDDRDAELQRSVDALETSLEEERGRLGELESENERLRNEREESRSLAAERGETIERLEGELAERQRAADGFEEEAAEAVAAAAALEAAMDEREAELEETRAAYAAAVERAEGAEAERDRIREELQREIAALERRIMELREEATAPPPPATGVDRYRYIDLLSVALATRHAAMTAEDADAARDAWNRTGETLDTMEEEFPDRNVSWLRERFGGPEGF